MQAIIGKGSILEEFKQKIYILQSKQFFNQSNIICKQHKNKIQISRRGLSMKFFSLKKFKKQSYDDDDNLQAEDEYVELNTEAQAARSSRIIVRPFVMNDFSDIKPVLDALRDGNTVALVNIRPLKEKDLVELKRAVNKLKKTCDAIEGDIAGFGDDYIVITPSFAQIYRNKPGMAAQKSPNSMMAGDDFE
jgi:SepF-like predicted cell division protein (DUF552 family)